MTSLALILAANAERLRWLERLTAAYETGTINHAQYLLARYALDRSHGLRSYEIDAIYCKAHDLRYFRDCSTGNGAPPLVEEASLDRLP